MCGYVKSTFSKLYFISHLFPRILIRWKRSCKTIDRKSLHVPQLKQLVWFAIQLLNMQIIAYQRRICCSTENTVYIACFAITVRARVDSASPGASSRPGADSCDGTSINRMTETTRNREPIFNNKTVE